MVEWGLGVSWLCRGSRDAFVVEFYTVHLKDLDGQYYL